MKNLDVLDMGDFKSLNGLRSLCVLIQYSYVILYMLVNYELIIFFSIFRDISNAYSLKEISSDIFRGFSKTFLVL